MFDSIGWAEILVLAVAGLFILGPERLPSAAAWLGRSVRKVREYATGARDQLKTELGPDYEELRKPLENLQDLRRPINQLRNFDPKRAVTKHLFDDVDTGNGGTKPNGHTPPKPKPATSEPAAPASDSPSIDPDAT